MKLTTARLLELAELGLSCEATLVYLTALTRMGETGSDRLAMPALTNLPGLPRSAKAMAKVLSELIGKGLAGDDPDGFVHFVSLAPDLSSKRAEAGRRGGLAKASKRLASASELPGGLPEALPAGSQANAPDPSSPLVLSSPDSLSSPSVASSLSEPDSCSESSGSRPESKPARGAKTGQRQRFVPDAWMPRDTHRALALELRVAIEIELAKFREHEFKDPKTDFDRAFSRWLRRSVEFRSSGVGGKPPPGSNFERLKARAERFEAEERQLEAANAAK